MELNDCEANVDDFSQVQMRFRGTLYDSDTSENNISGVVVTQFIFSHSTRDEEKGGVKKSEFRADGVSYQCADNNCDESDWTTNNTGDGYTNPDLNFGVFKKTNKTEFCVGYDTSNHELVFSAGDEVRTVNAVDNNLPDWASDLHVNLAWHTIEARTDAQNCQTDGMVSVYLEGDVDNIKVRRRQP